MPFQPGRHFLQLPGPANLPDRILRAIDQPLIDHRGTDFPELSKACLEGLKTVFQTSSQVVMFPSSGTGAWEAALVNTLSPGDRVLVYEAGNFSSAWARVAASFGLTVQKIEGDWRRAVDADAVRSALEADSRHEIRAVMVVHNETSTGVRSDIASVRRAIDAAGHPALLMVDTVSSLGVMDYRHDEWGVDVSVSASQKGMMLPTGLGFNAISAKALAASKQSRLPKYYWSWESMLAQNEKGFFPYTPCTNLLYGLREAFRMLEEEGRENVFRRHHRHAEATRRAVRTWGLEVYPLNDAEASDSLTAVLLPPGYQEAEVRGVIFRHFNMSLGSGLGKVAGKVFRIGHLGSFNDLMLAGTLSGVEMGLELAGVPHQKGGVAAALEYLTAQAKESLQAELAAPPLAAR